MYVEEKHERRSLIAFIVFIIAFFVAATSFFSLQSCQKRDVEKEVAELLQASPELDYQVCGNSLVNGYNFNFNDFKANKEICWYIRQLPRTATKQEISESLSRVFSQYESVINKPFVQVFKGDSVRADIIIEFKVLDAKGGMYGITAPVYDERFKRKRSLITFDEIDYLNNRKDESFFFEVSLHEAGHAIGLGHSEYEFAVMYDRPVKYRKTELTIDDAFGAREKYNIREDFVLNGKYYYYIKAGGKRQLSKNFTEKEFLRKCGSRESHYLAKSVVDGGQVLRDHYNAPVIAISSFRTLFCNLKAGPNGGASDSRHLHMDAEDYKLPLKFHYQFIEDIKLQRPILGKLIKVGIRGFGSYPYKTFHLDGRPGPKANAWYGIYSYVVWGEFKKSNQYGEDTGDDFKAYD